MSNSTTEPSVKQQSSSAAFEFWDKSNEKDFICAICKRYLNIFPISYNEETGTICGQCSSKVAKDKTASFTRQFAFENMVKHLTFPCVNKSFGCEDVLKLDNVQEHEKNCLFHHINCPLEDKDRFPGENCSWQGRIQSISEHLATHETNFLNPPMFEWGDDKTNRIYFTKLGNYIITMVIIHKESSKYSCSVMLAGTEIETQCFKYQLEISPVDKTDNNNSVLFRKFRLENLSNLDRNLNDLNKSLVIDFDNISCLLQDASKRVIVKFGIVKKNRREIIELIDAPKGQDYVPGTNIYIGRKRLSPLDEPLLAEFECPICNEYLVPPIFLCATGHSFCEKCKSKINVCPTCRSPAKKQIRNYTLEKITLKMIYPCPNREAGCNYAANSDAIKVHKQNCPVSKDLFIF